jgi:hypothetical protein
VRALANQFPSGDRDSADQIIAESRQPNARPQTAIAADKNILRLREVLYALALIIPPLSVSSEYFIAVRRIGPGRSTQSYTDALRRREMHSGCVLKSRADGETLLFAI